MDITNAVWLNIAAIIFLVIFITSMVTRNRVVKRGKRHEDNLHERAPGEDLQGRKLP